VCLIEDYQLGIMGLANMTWEGTRAHEVSKGSVTVRRKLPVDPAFTADFQSCVDIVRQYTRRARIAQSSALSPVADEHASPIGDDSQGEACPTDSGLKADQDRVNIAKTSTLPSDSTPRVTSLAADEG
nr:hypothetical protein [Tanacetum cinerariifolium]